MNSEIKQPWTTVGKTDVMGSRKKINYWFFILVFIYSVLEVNSAQIVNNQNVNKGPSTSGMFGNSLVHIFGCNSYSLYIIW